MDVKKSLEEFMKGQQVLTLATQGPEGLWTCSVYYGYSNGRIFFTSKKDTRHAKDIAEGAKVAFAIADSSQTPAGPYTIGAQGVGFCRPANLRDAPDVVSHYGLRFAQFREPYGIQAMLEKAIRDGISRAFVIEIERIKYTNEEVLPEKRSLVSFEAPTR